MEIMMTEEEWRATTYGQMYDMRLEDLARLCDEFKTCACRVPDVGDIRLKERFDRIQEVIQDLIDIKSDGGLFKLRESFK